MIKITDKMNYYWLFLLFVPGVLGNDGDEEITTLPADEFKCSLPDVKSIDDNLDLTRFRSDFSKISEVKFPGLIGPLNERLICKIKCIDGNWVGPLCSTTPDGRFQPVLRECMYRNDHLLLAVSFKNSSIEKDTSFPHGSVIQVRCKHFGHYKMKGEGLLQCENGEWAPKLPECVPTSVITNFTGDAPPTIEYTVVSGSGVVGAAGELLVYPDTSLRLACLSPRALGDPEWSWTQAQPPHHAEWSSEEGERDTHYTLRLHRVTARHSDLYTCASPSGLHTNSVAIRVVNVSCPPLESTSRLLRLFSQGSRLGHAAHFSCPLPYLLNGSAILHCMPDGRWSAAMPVCVEARCPALEALPPLSALELDAAGGGRAVFACAWGYRLEGPPGLECHAGNWSAPLPHCSPIYCPEPVVPENGELMRKSPHKEKHPVGDLITYSCLPGFELVGEGTIVCTEAGYWSHPPPFCLPPAAVRKPDTIYIENTTLVHFEE